MNQTMPATAGQKWRALFRRRCPRCRRGAIYEQGNRMNDRCPECGLLFHREPGYFLGALYISYGMASAILATALLLVHVVFPTWNLGWLVLVLGVLFLPFAPTVTRYARVLWIYFDRWAWPGAPGSSD